jgi:hypothetical protein
MNELNPKARLILILRHPVDRAISAYNFTVKRNMESETLRNAVKMEAERLLHGNLRTLSNNTYVDHGLYYKQLQRLYMYFDPSQVLILLFEDVKNSPEACMRKIYRFIDIDDQFTPSFKTLNKTGSVRFKWIMNMIYNDSKFKNFLMKNVIDRLVPYDWKYRIKLLFLNLVTRDKKKKEERPVDPVVRQELVQLFLDDIEQLENLLDRDLSAWKK